MQRELGLPERPEVPVLAMITRLASHKGIDLLCYIARRLLGMDVQLVILGTGEQRFENFSGVWRQSIRIRSLPSCGLI